MTKIIIEETLENKGFSLIPTILKDICSFWDETDWSGRCVLGVSVLRTRSELRLHDDVIRSFVDDRADSEDFDGGQATAALSVDPDAVFAAVQ